jgi:hypothetical protein
VYGQQLTSTQLYRSPLTLNVLRKGKRVNKLRHANQGNREKNQNLLLIKTRFQLLKVKKKSYDQSKLFVIINAQKKILELPL